MPRAIIIVLDSLGVGHAPDAADYGEGPRGDEDANTLGHIVEACTEGRGDREGLRSGPLVTPNLDRLGLRHCLALSGGAALPRDEPEALWGVMREVSKGKDTPSGHWEIAGQPVPFDWHYFPKTEPCFPKALTDALIRDAKIPGILGNRHASGTAIIAELGEESVRTGQPICYTSADSVFQIAAHEDAFGLERLYAVCEAAFKLTAPMKVGRVIARPFVGEAGGYTRTANRHDYAIAPPEPTIFDRVVAAGAETWAVGKIADIFAHRSITESLKAGPNDAVHAATLKALHEAPDRALVFANYVDFDQLYGHRRDVPGYAAAIEQFDGWVPELEAAMRDDDMLVLTADHGNDPTWHGTDHTREQVPVMVLGAASAPVGHRDSFADIAATVLTHLGIERTGHGTPITET